jgi:hypothetical protein
LGDGRDVDAAAHDDLGTPSPPLGVARGVGDGAKA